MSHTSDLARQLIEQLSAPGIASSCFFTLFTQPLQPEQQNAGLCCTREMQQASNNATNNLTPLCAFTQGELQSHLKNETQWLVQHVHERSLRSAPAFRRLGSAMVVLFDLDQSLLATEAQLSTLVRPTLVRPLRNPFRSHDAAPQ